MSVEEKAAEMKMFGKLTRKTFEWHPSKLLCKRFNIPEPYPSSSKTGLVYEKKEKFTLGKLFETSQKEEKYETICLNRTTNVSDNPTAESGEKVILENLNTEEKVKINSTPGAMVTFDQKGSEKPSMDLFKAIFASSSEDESGNSEDEEMNNEQSSQLKLTQETSSANVVTVSKQQTETSHQGKFEDTYRDGGSDKHVSLQASVEDSNNQIVKAIPKYNNTDKNVMEVEEEEYGPRPPPPLRSQREEIGVKLVLQSHQTVPFSRYDSHSESDSDRRKRKHKKKQKHKSKHKNKNKDKDKSTKRENDRPRKNDWETLPNSRQKPTTSHEQTDKSEHKEIPDDKQILSRLKAVQKRRKCAADFM
jgi:G patch domain-containing protein 1